MKYSIRLSGKTSQIVHKMLQDMMLGTLDKNRVEEFNENKVAKPKSLSDGKKLTLMEIFLRNRIENKLKDKFDDEQEDIKNNPQKYDIFEERETVTQSEGLSTARKVFSPPKDLIDIENTKSKPEKKRTIDLGDSENNSINAEYPEKETSSTKLIGYHYKKDEPRPEVYENYLNKEEEFFPSILNE